MVDKFNADNAVDRLSEAVGVPPDVINPDDVVDKIRQQKAAAMQQQAAMMQAQQAAGLAKTASEADMSGDNALTAVQKNTEAV